MKIIKFLKKTVFVLCVIIFIISITSLISIIASARKNTVPSFFGYSAMNIYSASMRPTYKEGDLVVIKKTEVTKLKKGDVISFFSEDPTIYGALNTHRINDIKKENGKYVFVTKGDNNDVEDEYTVSYENIVGKAVFSISNAGKVVSFFQKKAGAYFLVIILPLLIIMLFEAKEVYMKFREAREDNEKEDK